MCNSVLTVSLISICAYLYMHMHVQYSHTENFLFLFLTSANVFQMHSGLHTEGPQSEVVCSLPQQTRGQLLAEMMWKKYYVYTWLLVPMQQILCTRVPISLYTVGYWVWVGCFLTMYVYSTVLAGENVHKGYMCVRTL